MLYQDCEIIAHRVRVAGKPYKFIFGFPRGGLVPAVILSHLLDTPLITDLVGKDASEVLFVDDICDTGQTIIDFENKIKGEIDVATLILSSRAGYLPKIYSRTSSPNEWIVFPWETLETSKKDN